MDDKETDEKPHRDTHRRARNRRSCRDHDKPYQHKDHLTTNPKETMTDIAHRPSCSLSGMPKPSPSSRWRRII